jgi:hypothetical protein
MDSKDVKDVKAITKSVQELAKIRSETACTVKNIKTDLAETKNLSKGENKPWLIRTGVALMVMPDPLVTSVIGAGFLAAGAVQQGIKHQAVYVDDLPKALGSAMKTLKNSKDLL